MNKNSLPRVKHSTFIYTTSQKLLQPIEKVNSLDTPESHNLNLFDRKKLSLQTIVHNIANIQTESRHKSSYKDLHSTRIDTFRSKDSGSKGSAARNVETANPGQVKISDFSPELPHQRSQNTLGRGSSRTKKHQQEEHQNDDYGLHKPSKSLPNKNLQSNNENIATPKKHFYKDSLKIKINIDKESLVKKFENFSKEAQEESDKNKDQVMRASILAQLPLNESTANPHSLTNISMQKFFDKKFKSGRFTTRVRDTLKYQLAHSFNRINRYKEGMVTEPSRVVELQPPPYWAFDREDSKNIVHNHRKTDSGVIDSPRARPPNSQTQSRNKDNASLAQSGEQSPISRMLTKHKQNPETNSIKTTSIYSVPKDNELRTFAKSGVKFRLFEIKQNDDKLLAIMESTEQKKQRQLGERLSKASVIGNAETASIKPEESPSAIEKELSERYCLYTPHEAYALAYHVARSIETVYSMHTLPEEKRKLSNLIKDFLELKYSDTNPLKHLLLCNNFNEAKPLKDLKEIHIFTFMTERIMGGLSNLSVPHHSSHDRHLHGNATTANSTRKILDDRNSPGRKKHTFSIKEPTTSHFIKSSTLDNILESQHSRPTQSPHLKLKLRQDSKDLDQEELSRLASPLKKAKSELRLSHLDNQRRDGKMSSPHPGGTFAHPAKISASDVLRYRVISEKYEYVNRFSEKIRTHISSSMKVKFDESKQCIKDKLLFIKNYGTRRKEHEDKMGNNAMNLEYFQGSSSLKDDALYQNLVERAGLDRDLQDKLSYIDHRLGHDLDIEPETFELNKAATEISRVLTQTLV